MKQYELLYILPSTLAETEVPDQAGKVAHLLQENGAHITQEVDLGKKKLAYPIARQSYGYYRLVEFTAESPQLQKLNDLFRLAPEVVRHQIVAKPVKSQATVEREQALRARLAARRQQRAAAAAEEARTAASASGAAPTALTPEEFEKKIERIIEENPER